MTVPLAVKNIQHRTGIEIQPLADIIESLTQDNSVDNIEQELVDLINLVDRTEQLNHIGTQLCGVQDVIEYHLAEALDYLDNARLTN